MPTEYPVTLLALHQFIGASVPLTLPTEPPVTPVPESVLEKCLHLSKDLYYLYTDKRVSNAASHSVRQGIFLLAIALSAKPDHTMTLHEIPASIRAFWQIDLPPVDQPIYLMDSESIMGAVDVDSIRVDEPIVEHAAPVVKNRQQRGKKKADA